MANRKKKSVARPPIHRPPAIGKEDAPLENSTRDAQAGSGMLESNTGVWLMVGLTLFFCLMTFAHISGVNGPYYWKWPWRRLALLQWLVMIASTLPAWGVVFAYSQQRFQRSGTLLLSLMFAAMTMKLGCVLSQDNSLGWNYLRSVTWSPEATSYYVDAVRVVETVRQGGEASLFWLGQYDQIIRTPPPDGFNLHTSTKPVGPLALYILLVSELGHQPGAVVVSGILLMLMSLTSIVAIYWCVHRVSGSLQAARLAAAVVAVAPGFALFPTKLDALWIGLGAMAVGTWYMALVMRNGWYSLALGGWLAIMLLVGFQQLTLGLFMALMPAVVLWDSPLLQRYLLAVRMGLPAMGIALVAHILLALATSYNSWKVFQANLFVQSQLMLQPMLKPRQAPWTTLWDLYDYALGGGWVLGLVFIMGLFSKQHDRQTRGLGWAAFVLMAVVAVLALIPAETARCWLFMSIAPLLLIAAHAGRWDSRRQAVLLACLLLSTLVIHGNMTFILP